MNCACTKDLISKLGLLFTTRFEKNLTAGVNQSIFITILYCRRDEKARWAVLTVHKVSYSAFYTLCALARSSTKVLSRRLRLNGACTKVLRQFLINIAFICNISFFCISPYARLQQHKLGGIKVFLLAPMQHTNNGFNIENL